jgi:hypothetical protein
MILLPVYFSNPEVRGYSVSFVRDCRSNRSHTLMLKVDGCGVDSTVNRTYKMSWRRFKKAILRDYLVHL